MFLCSSSEKRILKKAFKKGHFIFWTLSYRAKKGGNIGSHSKPKSTFFGRNKKNKHKLLKAFYFIKMLYVLAEFIEFFSKKGFSL